MWNTLGSSSQSFYPRDTSAWVGGGGGKDGFWPWRGIVFIASWTKFLCLQVPSYQWHIFPNQPLTAQAADVLPFLRSAGRKRPSLKAHLGRFSSSCDIGLFQRASVCIPYPLVSCGHGKYPFPSFFFFWLCPWNAEGSWTRDLHQPLQWHHQILNHYATRKLQVSFSFILKISFLKDFGKQRINTVLQFFNFLRPA